MTEFLESVIGTVIQAGQYHLLDDWVCAIARMGWHVGPFLDQVAKCPAAVVAYYAVNVDDLSRNKLSNAFWELPCPGHDAIVKWFDSDAITTTLCENL